MKHIVHICTLLLLLLFITPAHSDVMARYGGEFMSNSGGARSLALGNTGAALRGTSWMLFLNPAGLYGINHHEVAFMHSERFAGVVDYDVASAIIPQRDGSVLAFGLVRHGVNGIPFTKLENPNTPLSDDNRVVISKIVTEGQYAFYASKSNAWRKWHWGIAPKLIFKHIGSDYRAYGLGIDAGVNIRPWDKIPMDLGLSAQDLLGTVVAWEQTGRKEIIAPSLRLGIAINRHFEPLEADVSLISDLVFRSESISNPNATSANYGLEYTVRNIVALRMGREDARYTFGGGIRLAPINIDYAFIGHDDLGNTHRVSLNYRW